MELTETNDQSARCKESGRERYRLLLVDDEEHVREALKISLEQRGYDVTECSDALQALDLLRAGHVPDLILLDLMMPDMDGWEFRLEQKQNRAWARIPVIAISADQSAKARAMDAESYLPKPFDQQQLYETVERVITAVRGRHETEQTDTESSLASMGRLAGELVEHLEQPIGYTIANLQLAKSKVEELEARLERSEAFSAVGIRQLLTRAQRGAERIAGLTQGTATFAALMGRRAAQPRPRILVVEHDLVQVARIRDWLGGDYTLEIVDNVTDALEAVDQVGPYDAVLCELSGPGFEGVAFYEALAARHPEQAGSLIFMSEGSFSQKLRAFLAAARRPQLRRPLQPQALRHLLARQLHALH